MSEPVIDLLAETWDAISQLCDELSEDEWDRPTDLPGWSVRDVVSHMIGTERMLRGDAAPPPPEGSPPHVLNPIGAFNEGWVAERRGRSGAEVLAEFREITAERMAALRALPAEEWETIGFTPEGEGPYRKFMEIRAFDCWEHEQDIRRALARPGHLAGPVASHSLGKVAAALGYIVGKKAGAPDGSSVVFEVSGPTVLSAGVVVEGRARLVEPPPPDPTVTVAIDTETFNALGCGRWTIQEARERGSITLRGDTDLGERVLANMAFTI